MLKWLFSAIAITTVDLYGPIRRLTAQSISPVISHGDIHADPEFDLLVRHAIHFCGSLADKVAQHHALSSKFDNRELDTLIVGERFAEGFALIRVFDGLIDAILGGAETRGCLPNPVFVHKSLRDRKAVI
jgi:hypothetical protein